MKKLFIHYQPFTLNQQYNIIDDENDIHTNGMISDAADVKKLIDEYQIEDVSLVGEKNLVKNFMLDIVDYCKNKEIKFSLLKK